ncbi:MAG: hypothetical protein QOE38_2257 [Thermoleophilaceae bacterium]|jgi:hypothetical protein|nr:hypothetical protein [Thermoleophilaceae bacterium]
MAGHRRFDELKDALLRVPGGAARIAVEKRNAEKQIHSHDADGGAAGAEAPVEHGVPARSQRPAGSTKRN